MPIAQTPHDTDLENTDVCLFGDDVTWWGTRPGVSSNDPQPCGDCRPADPYSPDSAVPGADARVPAGTREPSAGSSEDVGGSGKPDLSPIAAPSAERGSTRPGNAGDSAQAVASDAGPPKQGDKTCRQVVPLLAAPSGADTDEQPQDRPLCSMLLSLKDTDHNANGAAPHSPLPLNELLALFEFIKGLATDGQRSSESHEPRTPGSGGERCE